MGELGAFLKLGRIESPERSPAERVHDYHEFVRTLAGTGARRAGRALHGVRRAVLPQRLPGQQPDPGLERPRLPRPLGGCDRAAAPDEQLPGFHRALVPRAVRGGVRARDPRGRGGDDQADRARDREPRLGRGLDRPEAAGARDRPLGRGDRRRPRRDGVRAAAAPCRARGDAVRARRGGRRARSLRRPRLQDREVDRRAARRAARGRRCRAPLRLRGRRQRAGRGAARVRCGRDRDRRARPARPAGSGSRAGRRPFRDGLPLPAQPFRRTLGGARRRERPRRRPSARR